VIAMLNGAPVGCGRFEFGPERTYIEVGRLSVLPAHRGRGIATGMLAWFESRAAALGVPEVRLGVRLNLPRNIALYERAGYEVFDYEIRPDYGRVAAWMRKSVARAAPRAPGYEPRPKAM
jgi:ribosomal protein S18 acetylase RimI-like enzyme